MTADSAARVLKFLFRLLGTSSLFALIFVAAPREWMTSIHSWLGMGVLPDSPVVWYLARSTSALYALVGGVFWVVSSDLRRHRRVATYLGCAVAVFGVILLVVDWTEGLPLFWKIWEGPFLMAFGATVLYLSRAIGSGDAVDQAR